MRTMKRYNTLLHIAFVFILSVAGLRAGAQVKTADYYYNNFDGGSLGSDLSKIGSTLALDVSSTSPIGIGSSHSLSTTGSATMGGFKFSFLTIGTNLNNETYGYEWTFVYKNGGENTNDSKIIDDGENAWKYWLFANNTDLSDMKGYYLTQNGSSMELRVRISSNDDRSLISYDLSQIGGNNTTYAIRVQRIKRGNQYVWQLFIDPYSSLKKEASTSRGDLNYEANIYNTYNYSGLIVSSTTNGRFKFDEFKTYSMKLLFSGANAASNGISSPLYAGQQNAVIYGLQVQTRGYFDVYQFKVELTGSATSILDKNTAKLNKSFDSFFGNVDDIGLVNVPSNDFWDAAIQYYGSSNNPFVRFWSTGNADGSLGSAGYLFISANVLNNPNTSNSFAFVGAPLIKGASAEQNYAGSETVVNPGTATSGSGKVYDWASTGSKNWSLASNWKLGDGTTPSVAPGANDLVRIGIAQNYSESPILAANTKIGNLTVGTGKGGSTSLTINSAATLTVAGAFTNQRALSLSGTGNLAIEGNWLSSGGKIDLASGNVIVKFTGTKSQLLQDDGSDLNNGVVFGNVVFSGGGTKTLGGIGKFAVAVGKYLTMESNTILQASGILTLKASALGSASLSAIPANSSIQGKVTVERFVQGGNKAMYRTYRMWSSPVYDNTNDFTNANVVGGRSFKFTQFIDDIIITGKDGVGNGFDFNAANTTSAWTYNNGFIAIPSINTSINVGRGAYLVYRGNRSNYEAKVSSPYTDPESMVITYQGTLNQQNITVPLVHGTTGFSMLGNPYAATIDWQAVTKTNNVASTVRVWNPQNKQYASYNGEFGVNGGGRYIAPGQAFFVQTTDNNSPSVTFTETSKTAAMSQSSPLYNTVMSVRESNVVSTFSSGSVASSYDNIQEQPSVIKMKLQKDGTENSDEALVVLKSGELATVASKDVTKMNGEIVFLSSLSQENKKMAINYMPHASEITNVKLNVSADSSGMYKLFCEAQDMPFGYEAKLKDKYLNTITDLRNQGTTYTFSIDKTIAASFGENRFELLFTPATTLPVELNEFVGKKANQGIALNWSTSSEVNNSHFEILRAGEDQSFGSIGKVQANASRSYSLLDNFPLVGNNYYKLLQVDKNGKSVTLPKIVVVKYDLNASNNANGMMIFPTIIQSNFTLKYIGSLQSNQFILKVTDISGKEIYSKTVDKLEVINGYSGELSKASSGVYFATLIDASNGRNIGAVKLIKN